MAAGSNVEQIKEKLDIAEFLRGYLKLQPAGKNFKALCPFHNEKTPSFMISPERQSWHCFGCGIGGDVFSFLMRYENIEFGEALKTLAERAGIDLKFTGSQDYKFSGLLYELNDAAKKFFVKELAESEEAVRYLKERGLSRETIEEFEIGFAPQGTEALNLYLINAGYAPEDIVRAGLALKTERGLQLDRFRGRIMFPIHNHMGKVVGFTGRILPRLDEGTMGKYVNSPETPIFAKSRLLYGFWKTKNAIREANTVFLVEGQMDFLMSYQAGIKNVVASSGTALTEDHLKSLKRLADQMIVSFDNDEAGLAAGERAIDLAEGYDFNVKVVTFEGVKDPAEAIMKDPAGFRKSFAAASPAPEFYFKKYLREYLSLEPGERHRVPGFKRGVQAVLRKLNKIASPIERAGWLKELSRLTAIDEKILSEEMEKVGAATSTVEEHENVEAPAPAPLSRRALLSQHFLAASLAAERWDLLDDSITYFPAEYQEICRLLRSGARSAAEPVLDELMDTIVLLSGGIQDENIEELMKFLKDEYVKDERRSFIKTIRQAEAEGNQVMIEMTVKKLHHGTNAHSIKNNEKKK